MRENIKKPFWIWIISIVVFLIILLGNFFDYSTPSFDIADVALFLMLYTVLIGSISFVVLLHRFLKNNADNDQENKKILLKSMLFYLVVLPIFPIYLLLLLFKSYKTKKTRTNTISQSIVLAVSYFFLLLAILFLIIPMWFILYEMIYDLIVYKRIIIKN